MTSSIANHGETLAPLMRRAGFRYVFLGIENVLDEDLQFLRASAKNAQREGGRQRGNATVRAIERLHAAGIAVVGGIIVGNPDDTRESIETNLSFAQRYVDWPYIQHPTPYPGTPMTEDFRRARPDRQRTGRGVRRHDRGRADASTSTADEIEFMRWRAERWMKLRHLPSVLRHYPGFVLRQCPRCARTRSAEARGDRRWGSRASAMCFGATSACVRVNANTCPQCLPTRGRSGTRR